MLMLVIISLPYARDKCIIRRCWSRDMRLIVTGGSGMFVDR